VLVEPKVTLHALRQREVVGLAALHLSQNGKIPRPQPTERLWLESNRKRASYAMVEDSLEFETQGKRFP
jgi:hypothetical protein